MNFGKETISNERYEYILCVKFFFTSELSNMNKR